MRSTVVLAALTALAIGGCTASANATPVPRASTPPVLSAAARTPAAVFDAALRLVTIGDSFTYGQGVSRRDSWPNQLVAILGDAIPLELTANLAETSKTSQDVIDEQLELVADYQPDVVMLQVGANDVHSREVTPERYRANIRFILDTLLAELAPDRVFIVTTPDYTLTERGGAWADREARSAAIAEINMIIMAEARIRSIRAIDITPVSRLVAEDPSLVASNGQDPSEKQYAGWVELIAPVVRFTLAGGQP